MTIRSFPSGLWALAPCQCQELPDNRSLIIRGDNGAVSLQAGYWKSTLGHLHAFRPMHQHLQVLLARMPTLRPVEPRVRDFLLLLHRDGLLISGQNLADHLTKSSSAPTRKLAPLRIAIITCDRPNQLNRLLISLAENEFIHGNTWAYEIVDDSRHPDAALQNQALIAHHGNRLELRYHGRREREAFILGLTRKLPSASDHLRWLMNSWNTAHLGHATYGCPKNYLMLRFAGERILFIDDDTVMRAWIRPMARKSFCFGEIGQERMIFEDFETLTSSLRLMREDPIAQYNMLLGRSLGEAIPLIGASATSSELFGKAGPNHISGIDFETARILAIMSALAGDPGTVFDIYLFTRKTSLMQLSADDAAYQRLLSKPRCIFNGEAWWSLFNRGYFMLTTMAGIDLGSFFPPLLPIGRGEDMMIGSFLKLFYPRDVVLMSPWGLEHHAEPPRLWQPLPENLASQFSPSSAWNVWAENAAIGYSSADPVTKLLALKGHFTGLDATEAGRRQLCNSIHAAARRFWAAHYSQLINIHHSGLSLCPRCHADILNTLASLQIQLLAPNPLPPPQVDYLLHLNRRYFETIETWNLALDQVRHGHIFN